MVSTTELELRTLLPRNADATTPLPLILDDHYKTFFSCVREINHWLTLNQLSGRRVLGGKNTLAGVAETMGVEMRSSPSAPSGLDDVVTLADICIK